MLIMVIMTQLSDGDGQYLPEYIPSLVKEIENGYDIVNNQDLWMKRSILV